MSTPKPSIDSRMAAEPARPLQGERRTESRAHGVIHWLMRAGNALLGEVSNLSLRLLSVNAVISILPNLGFPHLRVALYKLAGINIGAHSLILGRMEFTGSPPRAHRLSIGASTMINDHCFVDLNAEITIGDHVSIGHHVTFVTAEHELGPAACRAGKMRAKPITIEAGCWIGAHSTLLPGTHIGASSVVAAGSLVHGNVPANRLVGGVPARALKTLASEP